MHGIETHIAALAAHAVVCAPTGPPRWQLPKAVRDRRKHLWVRRMRETDEGERGR